MRTELRVQTPTTIELDLQIETRLLSGSQVKMYLSTAQFTPGSSSPSCFQDAQQKLCTLETAEDSYVITMDLACPDNLCEGNSLIFIAIAGFDNRYSTLSSSSDRVRFETFDPTGAYIIDSSTQESFSDVLVPVGASIDQDSIQLTND